MLLLDFLHFFLRRQWFILYFSEFSIIEYFFLNVTILCQRDIILPNRLFQQNSIFFFLIKYLMIFPRAITSQTCKIWCEIITRTFSAFMRWGATVISSIVLTSMDIVHGLLTGWFPFCYVEIFSSDQPIHTALFGSGWYKSISFAFAILARSINFFPEIAVIMLFDIMSTETFGLISQPKAFRFLLLIPICNLFNMTVT